MQEAAAANDLLRSVEADIRFHEYILSRSGQAHTAQVWRSIQPRIRAYFFRYGKEADLNRIAFEHGDLLQTLQSGDAAAIMGALENHITIRTPAP